MQNTDFAIFTVNVLDNEIRKNSILTKILLTPFSSKYSFVIFVLLLGIIAGLIYWYREQINLALTSALENIIFYLGVGIIPAFIWTTIFATVLFTKPRWLLKINIWIGSLVILTASLGILDFLKPAFAKTSLPLINSRIPAHEIFNLFTLDGGISPGGHFGELIIGQHSEWISISRILALFLLASGIITPKGTFKISAAIAKLLFYIFSIVTIALKNMWQITNRRLNTTFKHDTEGIGGEFKDINTQLSELDEHIESSEITEHDIELDETLGLEETPESLIPESFSPNTKESLSSEGKFNKFWKTTPKIQSNDLEQDNGNLNHVSADPILDTTAALWKHPPMNLLEKANERGISEIQMSDTANTIKTTLGEYGVEVEIGEISPGPTVTMYGLVPGWVRRYKQTKVTDQNGQSKLDEDGKPIINRVETKTRVKVDSIMSREKDLSLSLMTPSIRIETPVMGKALVGIEVPNPSPDLVTLRSGMESDEFKTLRSKTQLPIALGRGSGGENVIIDLTKMPHLLIAGSTGSGKSVCLNTIVSNLIMEKTPAEVRLLLIDPKRVELTPYNGIPHLLTPVVVETDQVVSLLKGLIREMLNRYRRMEEAGARNIESFNQKSFDKMPYLVVAVDELADLMMAASFDVEQSLCRLAQLGRATGIHLVIATQRPSVDVLTGLIKANFPSRISFGVTSQIDSRTILDSTGAEKLLGKGDMLYLAVDASKPQRVQGVFISDKEVEDLVNFWKTTPWAPLPKVSLHAVGDEDTADEDERSDHNFDKRDELLDKAIELAHSHNKLSTSMLQRRMRIGYPRAARLMDQLEEEGVVGPSEGSKSRDVIINNT